MSFKDNVAIAFSLLAICCCLLTLGQLVLFLSSHAPLRLSGSSVHLSNGYFESVWLQVMINLFLLALFTLQHSLQNSKVVKDALSRIGYGAFERLLYNMGSCFVLQVLMQFWHPISSWIVWEIPTSNNSVFWWLFVIIHGIAWLLIYSGCYIMDLTELLGAKQIFYGIQGWPEPLTLKSDGLRRFYSHMRHPSFSALSVILFVHPTMQLDRLLLAYGIVIYTILCTRVDDEDYAYQRRLLQRKERDLNFNE